MLQHLVELAPPPTQPAATGIDEDWLKIEAEIGLELPQDFKDYIRCYGAGQWLEFFGIIDPFYEWKHPQAQKNWRAWIIDRIGHLNNIEERVKNYYASFKPYPAVNGLLAFGYDDNGGTLCWQTTGKPDQWPIVCLDGKTTQEYDLFDMPLTEFLAGVVSEKICPATFAPDLFPAKEPYFRSYQNEQI
jgi:hypothetical protein